MKIVLCYNREISVECVAHKIGMKISRFVERIEFGSRIYIRAKVSFEREVQRRPAYEVICTYIL